MKPILAVKNITKKFGDCYALRNVSLEIKPGEVVVLIGPSGGGKSTLLRCLMQLANIDAGEICVGDLCVASTGDCGSVKYASADVCRQAKLKMGMVFQNFPLFPHKTVLDNLIEAPILVKKVGKTQAVTVAKKLLQELGLLDKCHAYPCELSGGQKQRIAIARALAMQPQIMLFDEPTSALDPELVTSIIDVIKRLIIGQHKTVIITTHQLNFAAEIADKLVLIDQGEIIEVGTADQLLNNPQSKRLQLFLDKLWRPNCPRVGISFTKASSRPRKGQAHESIMV